MHMHMHIHIHIHIHIHNTYTYTCKFPFSSFICTFKKNHSLLTIINDFDLCLFLILILYQCDNNYILSIQHINTLLYIL